MQLNITGHHLTVTAGLKTIIEEKIHTISSHFDHINTCHVVLSIDNKHSEKTHKGHSNHKAEAIIRVRGVEFFAHAECDDMYEAIVKMSAKLDKQILKHKMKIKPKHVTLELTADEESDVAEAI